MVGYFVYTNLVDKHVIRDSVVPLMIVTYHQFLRTVWENSVGTNHFYCNEGWWFLVGEMDVAGDDRVVLLESGRNGSEENGFCVG